MSTRKAFHELHPIIGGLNGRSFSERVVWGFVQLTYKREATTAVKIKDLFFHDIIGWYLKNKGDNLLKNRKLPL